MPKCKKFEAQVIDYAYGELDPALVPNFENHLTTCNSCTNKVKDFERVLHLVDEAEGDFLPHPIAPLNLEMRLYRKLAEVPAEKPSLSSRFSDYFSKFIFILQEQKAASICLFIAAVISIAFFVGNPLQNNDEYVANGLDTADARIQQYQRQDIQRSMEDVLRNKHLRNSDSWDTVSQLNRVKDHAQGTDLANIAKKHLKNVNSDF